jgi:hypothetical protein
MGVQRPHKVRPLAHCPGGAVTTPPGPARGMVETSTAAHLRHTFGVVIGGSDSSAGCAAGGRKDDTEPGRPVGPGDARCS